MFRKFAAECRANRLLQRHLTLEDWRCWQYWRGLWARGNQSGEWYWIKGCQHWHYGDVYNQNKLFTFYTGESDVFLSARCGLHLPAADHVLVGKLLIENAEDVFLYNACNRPVGSIRRLICRLKTKRSKHAIR